MSNCAEIVANWICDSTSTSAMTGAGISTESGVPDFRSPGGVWAKNRTVYFDEFQRSADARYEYWRQKAEAHREFSAAEPNVAHRILANWESAGRLRGVVTQNIDGLHQLAGSSNVLELHGTARQIACLACAARFEADEMVARFLSEDRVPDCPECGGLLKHATVSFGQSLPSAVLDESVRWAQESTVFLTLGSSLVVHPAAGLPQVARDGGARVVIINRDPTPLDNIADAVIHGELGETMSEINQRITSMGGV